MNSQLYKKQDGTMVELHGSDESLERVMHKLGYRPHERAGSVAEQSEPEKPVEEERPKAPEAPEEEPKPKPVRRGLFGRVKK